MTPFSPTRRRLTMALAAGLAGSVLPVGAAARAQTPEAEQWSEEPALPIRVQEIYPAVLEDEIFVIGGLSPDVGGGFMGISERVLSWRPGEAEWRDRAPLPVANHHANCVGLNGVIYAIGGFAAAEGDVWSMLDVVGVYDPAADEWTPGPALPHPAAETVTGVIDGRIHMVAGRANTGAGNRSYNDHGDVADHLVLDAAAGTWSTAAPAPTARNSAAGAVIEGRLHVVGGRTVTGGNMPVHEVYEPNEDRWHTLAPLPEPAEGPHGAGGLAMAALDGRLWVFGGEWFEDGGGVYRQVWSWSPEADAWEDVSEMPLPRHGLGAVVSDGRIFTIGGAARAGADATSDAVHAFLP